MEEHLKVESLKKVKKKFKTYQSIDFGFKLQNSLCFFFYLSLYTSLLLWKNIVKLVILQNVVSHCSLYYTKID